MKYIFFLVFTMFIASCASGTKKSPILNGHEARGGKGIPTIYVHKPITVLKRKKKTYCTGCIQIDSATKVVSIYSITNLEEKIRKREKYFYINSKKIFSNNEIDTLIESALSLVRKKIKAKRNGGFKIVKIKDNNCRKLGFRERIDCKIRSEDAVFRLFEKSKQEALPHLVIPVNIGLFLPDRVHSDIHSLVVCYFVFNFTNNYVSFRYSNCSGGHLQDNPMNVYYNSDYYFKTHGLTDADLQFLTK